MTSRRKRGPVALRLHLSLDLPLSPEEIVQIGRCAVGSFRRRAEAIFRVPLELGSS